MNAPGTLYRREHPLHRQPEDTPRRYTGAWRITAAVLCCLGFAAVGTAVGLSLDILLPTDGVDLWLPVLLAAGCLALLFAAAYASHRADRSEAPQPHVLGARAYPGVIDGATVHLDPRR